MDHRMDHRHIKKILISDEPTTPELQAAAEQLGIPVREMRAMMKFATTVRRSAEDLEIPPPMVVSTLVNIIGDVIVRFFPDDEIAREGLLTDLTTQLTLLINQRDDTSETTH